MRFELQNPWTLTVIPHGAFEAGYGSPLAVPEGAGITVPAQVPGNFELDLVRGGYMEDPFFGTNIVGLREWEDRHLIYRTVFDAPPPETGSCAVLVFEGIDTFADVYVNGRLCLEADNMFRSYEIPLPVLSPHGNELLVHIRPAMIEAQKWPVPPSAGMFPHGYAGLYARKAASSFGWDILCRAVSGGIWRPVYLKTVRAPALRELFLYTRSVGEEPGERSDAVLNLYYAVDLGGNTWYPLDTPAELPYGYRLTVEGHCRDSTFRTETDLWHTCGNLTIYVPLAYLWYPKNAGEPCLYDVTVTLLRAGTVVDQRTMRAGIRTVELERTSMAGDDGAFCFRINHRPVFVMGTNWVPLDAFHSRDAERLPRALELLDDSGCNAVRCWGGNVYEDTAFFDFCDAHGILVWQDFAMGCAIYPVDERMQRALTDEVTEIVRKLRNHPSLTLWAGDNECDLAWLGWHAFRRNPNENVLTRRIIPDVLRLEDFTRPYLPSSPYVDEEAERLSREDPAAAERISENHLWGPRDYFKGDYYRQTVCHFASETGYHGCPAPASLREFIPEEELWPMYDRGTEDDPFAGTPHLSYLAHQTSMELNEDNVFGYRISLMVRQVRTMFRDVPRDLDTFCRMSQISQAEAMKYFIERFRVSKWRRTGIIWWNLLDGWPQVSDAVVGYDFVPKLAYFFIRRVQKPLHMAFTDPTDGCVTLTAVNDTHLPYRLRYTVRDVTGIGADQDLTAVPVLLAGGVTVEADAVTPAAVLPIEGREDHIFVMEWTTAEGAEGRSHYIAEPRGLDYNIYMQALGLCGFDDFYGF